MGTPNSGRVQAQWRKIAALYAFGMSPQIIANSLGCGSKAIIRTLKAKGYYKNPREKKDAVQPK